jgi:hypothetical protein
MKAPGRLSWGFERAANRSCVKWKGAHNLRRFPRSFCPTHSDWMRPMWCPNCKADVAAEVTGDNRRIHCAICGADITPAPALVGGAKTREARNLLERWASERKTETVTSPPAQPIARASLGGVTLEAQRPSATALPPAAPRAASRSAAGEFVSAPPTTAPAFGPVSQASFNSSYAPAPQYETPRLHRQHDPAPAPHFDVQGNLRDNDRRKTNWAAVVGHLLAYAGVGILTVGTTLVVWSYFGGPPAYAPTGWLTCVAGQMLLFLGVVTLVSGGIEQAGEEVKLRIERLGERMIRIEQIAREQTLRGPNIPPANYGAAGPTATSDLAREASVPQ